MRTGGLVPTLAMAAALMVFGTGIAGEGSKAVPAHEEPPLVGNPAQGEARAASCAKCHGVDGNGAKPTLPKLAGQNPETLEKQLLDFREAKRAHPGATGEDLALEDQEIADLAAWYGTQLRTPGEGNPLLAMRGKRLFIEGRPEDDVPPCAACHGKRGQGYTGVFTGGIPVIGAQPPEYVRAQLRAFRAAERTTDPRRVMQQATKTLSDDDIEGLSEYVAGLRPPGLAIPTE